MNQELEKPVSPFKDRRVQGLIVLAVVTAFLVGMVLDEELWKRQVVWGDIPTWLLAIGAGITAWIALVQLSDLRKQIAEEAKRNTKRDELMDKQIKEAERRETSERRRLVEDVDMRLSSSECIVVNNSRRPLTDIACKVMSKAGRHVLATPGGCGRIMPTPKGGGIPMPVKGESRFNKLRPDARCTFTFTDLAHEPDHVFVAWFSDDAGFRWQLDQYLHLVQSSDEDQYVP